MWNMSEETPGAMESGPPDAVTYAKETCEQSKTQIESLKEIMLRNKQTLKKKEEEVQEYAKRLSKIKSRAKLSRHSKNTASPLKDAASSSTDILSANKAEETSTSTTEEAVDDISQAKTPKAKSTLLQKKLAENRKAFEKRNKEIIETKRVVEEKVEAIRQQLEEKSHPLAETLDEQISIIPITPLMFTAEGSLSNIHSADNQEKEDEIMKLNHRIMELEATVVDLQENLKEKDSVIESKVQAVTLLSADLSKKGKTTLDTLEDTKDEMRTMQQHFVLLESSLKNKNESLLQQLQDRDNKISELEEELNRYNQQLTEQKLAEIASADFSRSTMDTLVETKDAMKGMQENFILIETSLKAKIDSLMQQLQEREVKLEEANERIRQFESTAEAEAVTKLLNLQQKFEELNRSHTILQDDNKILQQNIADIRSQINVTESKKDSEEIRVKDNRISELEETIIALKKERSDEEIRQQIVELSSSSEQYLQKIQDLEKLVQNMEEEKMNASKLQEDVNSIEGEKIQKLTQELDELNKSMIKMKAQHRSKMKNLQKQLESFKNVSDVNSELVRLGNQVALLEEEKGNLQLSLVDFDEIKASAGDMQGRMSELEKKLSTQAMEIKAHVDAIAALEDQKLDLMQELHAIKQEVSTLEAENAESENLRVTAEMKVVDLEEQLESLHKAQSLEKSTPSTKEEQADLLRQISVLTEESNEVAGKLEKIEEKNASDSGSTESFENIQEADRNELLRKIDDLSKKNQELLLKLSKSDEKGDSNADSTESFETINDPDKSDLSKTQESSDLTMKLGRIDEKGSSDTGSTESFERIPGHNENISKIELLTQENNDLVIKVTKLEEMLERIRDTHGEESSDSVDTSQDTFISVFELIQENKSLRSELTKLKSELDKFVSEHPDSKQEDNKEMEESMQRARRSVSFDNQLDTIVKEKDNLMAEFIKLQRVVEGLGDLGNRDFDVDSVRLRIDTILEENRRMSDKIAKLEETNVDMQQNLEGLTQENNELKARVDRMIDSEELTKERTEFARQIQELNCEKASNVTVENISKIELLTQENNDLVIKVTKLEEMLERMRDTHGKESSDSVDTSQDTFISVFELNQENKSLRTEVTKLKSELDKFVSEHSDSKQEDNKEIEESMQRARRSVSFDNQLDTIVKEKDNLTAEFMRLQRVVVEGLGDLENRDFDVDSVRLRIDTVLEENRRMADKIAKLDETNVDMQQNLESLMQENNELKARVDRMIDSEELTKERAEFARQIQELNRQKDSNVTVGRGESNDELISPATVAALEAEIQRCMRSIEEQNSHVEEMKIKLAEKDEELRVKSRELTEYNSSTGDQLQSLQRELRDTSKTIEEWKYKCDSMQERIDALVQEKAYIEESLKALEEENKLLVEEVRSKESVTSIYKEEMEGTIRSLEAKLREESVVAATRENEGLKLKESIESKDRELQTVFAQLRDKMIAIVSLQDELGTCKVELLEKNGTIESLTKELEELNVSLKTYDEELTSTRKEITALNEKLQDTKPLSEYNELVEKFREIEHTVMEMTYKINESAKENNELSAKLQDKDQHISELQRLLQQKEEDIAQLMTTNAQIDHQMHEIEDARNASEKRVWELEQSLAKSKIDTDTLNTVLDNNQKMLDLLREEHAKDIDVWSQKLEAMLDPANFKAQDNKYLQHMLKEIDVLFSHNMTEEAKAALGQKIDELKNVLTVLQKAEQAQSLKTKYAVTALKQKVVLCRGLEARVTELEEKWSMEKSEKEGKNKMMQEAEARMREKDDKIAELEKTVALAEEKYTAILSDTRSQHQCAVTNLEYAERENQRFRGELESKSMEVEELRETIDKLSASYEHAQMENIGLRAEVEKRLAEFTDEKSKVDKMLTDLEVLRNEREVLQDQAAALRKLLEESEAEIERLRTEASENAAQTAEIDRQKQGLHEDVVRLTNVEYELRAELATSSTRLEEMKLEIDRLLSTMDEQVTKIAEEKTSRQNIIEEYEAYKERVAKESEERQAVFEEVKENARELNVRMQVMESEYVQQLASIKNLKTENSLLLSKHAQINEKLENVEKTSEDRRVLLEQLQREVEKCATGNTRPETTSQATSTEEDAHEDLSTLASTSVRPLGVLHCEQCDQCQTLVQALEAKLQEREAEIENLDNELANSIGNFVQMRESIRYNDLMNNQSLRQNRSLEDPYNDLLLQYNALSLDYEEVKTKLQAALRDNEELTAKASDLEVANRTSREQLAAAEETLRAEKEACQRRIAELEVELERAMRDRHTEVSSLAPENSTPKLFDASQIFGAPTAAESYFEGSPAQIKTSDSSTDEISRVRRDVMDTAAPQESTSVGEIDVDLGDDGWGGDWGEIEAQDQHPVAVVESERGLESQLRMRINELQAQIDILEAEKLQVVEENKSTQIRCTKLTKMLKEYKAQIESLQQKTKEGKKSSDIFGLDSAIEEALQTRIADLEKALKDTADERKRIIAEKDIILKRLEIITSANERYMEAKEKQDRDMEILRIENREFTKKIETLESRLREPDQQRVTTIAPVPVDVTKLEAKAQITPDSGLTESAEKFKAELDDLKEEMEALASENEQLQRLLEEQKEEIRVLKSKAISDETKIRDLEELNSRNAELQNVLDESKARYDLLEKEYEQNLTSLNERLAATSSELEAETNVLRERLIESDKKVCELQKELEKVLAEKADLEVRITNHVTTEERLATVERSLMEVTELLNVRVQEVADLKQELMNWEAALSTANMKAERQNEEHALELQKYTTERSELWARLEETTKRAEELTTALSEKNATMENLEQELRRREVNEHMKEELQRVSDESDLLRTELKRERAELERVQTALAEKEAELAQKERAAANSAGDAGAVILSFAESEKPRESSRLVDGLPVFTMPGDNGGGDARGLAEKYRLQVEEQQQEIEHLRYVLSENTYPQMLQEMQDTMNILYSEKAQLESAMDDATQSLAEKQREIEALKRKVERQEDPRARHEVQEEIVRLQNELHAKEQEINDLRYVIAEKDAQLNFRASSEPSSDEFQLRETVNTLTNELYGKDREIQRLLAVVDEVRNEVAQLREVEALLAQATDARVLLEQSLKDKERELEESRQKLFIDVGKLTEELRSKENDMRNLTMQLQAVSAEKERILEEIHVKNNYLEVSKAHYDAISMENQKLVEDLRSRENQLENLTIRLDSLSVENGKLLEDVRAKERLIESCQMQLENLSVESNEKLQQKEDQLSHALHNLAEKERRLAELSITKDAEMHDLKVRIHEKEVRIEELIALSEEEEKQLDELRGSLDAKEKETEALREHLENKVQEYNLIRSSLKRDVSGDGPTSSSASESGSTSNELDLALYMLHQRDVRCEELTLELMQLLEERDTLQLRLSNAIKMNEELRRLLPSDASPSKSPTASSSREEPPTQEPSRSKAEGPVEIAKEAIHETSVGEDKEALAQKLSQLHMVGHAKDVRLRDERELRHTQQMSLYAHKDVLSSLPPEAAARLVNANYTLSRDVQSQSSVLLNWLWGKSTPKVVHM